MPLDGEWAPYAPAGESRLAMELKEISVTEYLTPMLPHVGLAVVRDADRTTIDDTKAIKRQSGQVAVETSSRAFPRPFASDWDVEAFRRSATEYTKKVTATRDLARQELVRLGIYTKSGKLSKHYR